MRILGIDPGLNTGLCVLEMEGKKFTTIWDDVTYGFSAALDQIVLQHSKLKCDYIALEDFVLLPHLANQVSANDPYLTAVMLKGAVLALFPSSEVFLFKSSQKSAVSDEDLKEAGLWYVRSETIPTEKRKHTRDAKRHSFNLGLKLESNLAYTQLKK